MILYSYSAPFSIIHKKFYLVISIRPTKNISSHLFTRRAAVSDRYFDSRKDWISILRVGVEEKIKRNGWFKEQMLVFICNVEIKYTNWKRDVRKAKEMRNAHPEPACWTREPQRSLYIELTPNRVSEVWQIFNKNQKFIVWLLSNTKDKTRSPIRAGTRGPS